MVMVVVVGGGSADIYVFRLNKTLQPDFLEKKMILDHWEINKVHLLKEKYLVTSTLPAYSEHLKRLYTQIRRTLVTGHTFSIGYS